jgi:hypothetical protein
LLINGETWDWIKRIKKTRAISAREYSELIIDRLRLDFDSAFAAIKTQRLLTKTRNPEYLKELIDHILKKTSSLAGSGHQRGKLRRHCGTTLFFQRAFTDLEGMSRALTIWNASFRDIAIATISALETTFLESVFSTKPTHSDAPSIADIFKDMDVETKLIRDGSDWAIMILNEARTLGNKLGTVKPTNDETQAAYRLARLTERIDAIWDFYDFFDVEGYARGEEIHFDAIPASLERKQFLSYFRVYSHDVDENFPNHAEFGRIREKFAPAVLAATRTSIVDFLASQVCRESMQELAGPAKDARRLLYDRLDSLVDLDQQFRLPSGRFTYRELASFWIFLYQFSYLLQLWCIQGLNSQASQPNPPIVETKVFEDFAAEALQKSVQKIRSYVRQFVSTSATKIDLFYKPLLEIGNNDLLIPTAPIQMSRFDRNLLHILVSEVSLDISEKGKRPLKRLATQFIGAGFKIAQNVPVYEMGQLATDIDFMAYKDGLLFLIQCKILSLSDNAYEEWKNRQSMLHAASQMDICIRNVKQAVDSRRPELGIAQSYQVVPVLITNVWDFTGQMIGGYINTDLSYLGNLLMGAEIRIKRLGGNETVAGMKLIHGEYPTGPELKHLVENPAHGRFIPMEGEYQDERIKVGRRTFVARVRVVRREEN